MADFKGYKEQRRILEFGSKEKRQPYITGGFAEDAVLYHKPSREHIDIDWFMLRDDLDYHIGFANKLGFKTINTYGNDTNGRPFYMSCTADESLWIDFAIADKDDQGNVYVEIGELLFDTTGIPPLKPIRIYFDKDIFNYRRAEFDGLKLQTVSPLGLYQLRAGLNVNNTFGELREKDIKAMAELKARFFPDAKDEDLVPRTELL
jgi:hypothetical protein